MIRFKRRNTLWLMMLGGLITFALVAGVANAPVQLALLAIFVMAAAASTIEFGRDRETIIDAIRKAPIRQRISPQAKEAIDSARNRGGYFSNDLMMMDIGLIASQTSYDGMAMRRTRSVSKDDDGVRPFVTLYVDGSEADRHANIRFEVFNQFGDRQFIHEMRTYLREGEFNVMADHHLPLAGNNDVSGHGDWDVRVYIDGNLVAVHHFMLAPSMNERAQRLRGERLQLEDDPLYEIIDEEPQELTPKLQDLLKQQQARPSSRSSSQGSRGQSGGSRQTTRRRRS